MQLSNVPEVRPARRLLVLGMAMFGVVFVFNVVTLVIAFQQHDGGRWLNLIRLVPNLLVPALIWRGYVLLAALAERASLYKAALDEDLPRLRSAVEAKQREDVRGP